MLCDNHDVQDLRVHVYITHLHETLRTTTSITGVEAYEEWLFGQFIIFKKSEKTQTKCILLKKRVKFLPIFTTLEKSPNTQKWLPSLFTSNLDHYYPSFKSYNIYIYIYILQCKIDIIKTQFFKSQNISKLILILHNFTYILCPFSLISLIRKVPKQSRCLINGENIA